MSFGGSYEQAVKIVIGANGQPAIDETVDKMRALEDEVRRIGEAFQHGNLTYDQAVPKIARLSAELNKVLKFYQDLLRQQAAVAAGYDTIADHERALQLEIENEKFEEQELIDVERARFASYLKGLEHQVQAQIDAANKVKAARQATADAEAEAASLLSALIRSHEREMGQDARREARETADAKKKEASDWAAYSKQVNDLIAKEEAATADERRRRIEALGTLQKADVSELAQKRNVLAAANQNLMKSATELVAAEERLAAAQAHEAAEAEAVNAAMSRNGSAATGQWLGAVKQLESAENDLAAAKENHAAATKHAVIAEESLTDAERAAATAKRRLASGVDDASQKTIHFTRTVYYASQAVQDWEYSFAAVINNLPLIANEAARAFGASHEQAMLWASGIALVGTAADIAWPRIKHLWDLVSTSDVASRPNASLKEMEDRLKAIKEGSWIIHIDPREIEELEGRVARLKRNLDAYNRAATGQTEVEQEAQRRFGVARAEFAGGTENVPGAMNIARTLAEAMATHPLVFGGDQTVGKDVQEIENRDLLRAAIARNPALGRQLGPALQEANRASDRAFGNILKAAQDIVGGAEQGKESSIGAITRIYDQFPGLFQARGMGDQFRQILGQAGAGAVVKDLDAGVQFKSPREAALAAKLAEKDDADKAEKERQELNEQGVAGQLEAQRQFIDEPAKRVAGVFRTKLQDAIDERAARLIAAGRSDRDVEAAIRGMIGNAFAAANVDAHLRGPATDELLRAAMARTEARIGAQGEVGAGARQADARRIVAEIDQKRADAAKRAADKAERERLAGIRDQLLPGPEERIMEQAQGRAKRADRQQAAAVKQDDLEQLFALFMQSNYTAQESTRLAHSSYNLWSRGYSVMAAIQVAQQQMWAEFQNANANMIRMQNQFVQGGRANTFLNRGGGVQPR